MAIFSSYDSFNARHLSFEDVGKSFIPVDEFHELCSPNHSLLLGPRGSGKTTLLKMLTLPALRNWSVNIDSDISRNKTFDAVYIPTDVHWKHQLNALAQALESNDEKKLYSMAAVTVNVLYSLVWAFNWRLSESDPTDNHIASNIAKELIRIWHLSPCLATLPAIRQRLTEKLSDIAIDANRTVRGESASRAGDFLYMDYLHSARAACEAFDRLTGRQGKWALCFDEIELAPDWLQDRLFQELRSTDERFLFKISTSPLPRHLDEAPAAERQDYAILRLWPHSKQERRSFASNLTSSIVRQEFGHEATPEKVFGLSPIAREDKEIEYGIGSQIWPVFRKLADRDLRFRKILEAYEINLDEPSANTGRQKDQMLRKAKPIALMRSEFTKGDSDSGFTYRSRKIPPVYHGADALYAISDTNPRWLRALIRELLERKKSLRSSPMIQKNDQVRVFLQGARQFAALVETLPDTTVTDDDGVSWSLSRIITQVAEYFSRRLLLEPFSLDPIGTFKVDARVPPTVEALLRTAVYHGVVILLDPPQAGGGISLSGLRLRLSYMFAPLFRLPLRQYNAINLSTILKSVEHNNEEHVQLFMEFLYDTD